MLGVYQHAPVLGSWIADSNQPLPIVASRSVVSSAIGRLRRVGAAPTDIARRTRAGPRVVSTRGYRPVARLHYLVAGPPTDISQLEPVDLKNTWPCIHTDNPVYSPASGASPRRSLGLRHPHAKFPTLLAPSCSCGHSNTAHLHLQCRHGDRDRGRTRSLTRRGPRGIENWPDTRRESRDLLSSQNTRAPTVGARSPEGISGSSQEYLSRTVRSSLYESQRTRSSGYLQ
jgi:hypothetical protein